LRRYWTWNVKVNPNIKYRDAGVGMVVKGNNVFMSSSWNVSHREGGSLKSMGWHVYEISDNKIQWKSSFYDRLSIAEQGAQGWLQKRMINSIVNQMEKGLH